MSEAPAALPKPPTPSRKRRRLLAGFILSVLLLLTVALALPWLLYRFEHARLEREAGPLRLERFARPRMPPGNPAFQWLAAGERVRLAKAESKTVGDAVKGGASAILASRPQLMVLLERNREALQQALEMEDGPSSLNVDYRVLGSEIPNLFPQLLLARLLHIQGLLALHAGDVAGAAAAVRSLGLQARVLQREPVYLTQRLGLYSEKLQLILLRSIAQEAPPGADPRLDRFLLSTDLQKQYRENITLNAVSYLQGVKEWLAKPDPRLEKASKDEAAKAFGRLAEHWTATGLSAAAMSRYRLYLQAYDRHYEWIAQELAKDPKEMGPYEKLEDVGGPKEYDLPVIYRATSASRLLIGACLAVRSGSLSCKDAGKLGPVDAHLRSVLKPDGSCMLRTWDGKDYLRYFKPEHSSPIPQDCTVFSPPPESPPRTAPAPADRAPGTATAPSAPAPSK